MRTVGRRTGPPMPARTSADALRRGWSVTDAAATFGWATGTGQRKGVCRLRTFEAMEHYRIECLAAAMAERARR